MHRLANFREILRYVPQYRDKVFVIAIDGFVVEDDNFRNVLLDIALLGSLRIGVVLVHGASHQIRRLAEATKQQPSNFDGIGLTDAATLQLALTAANRVTHEFLEGLAAADLRGACGNAVVAHPAGILGGVDQQWTGRIDGIDVSFFKALLERDIVPVVPPLGCDGEGLTYRLNSDAVAMEVAKALGAAKLIYLTSVPGIEVANGSTSPEVLRQLSLEEAEEMLKKHRNDLVEPSLSKLTNGIRACRGGVPRVHVLDGRTDLGLLTEVFSNEGVGTLIHVNDYQAIRVARKKDARAINALIKAGVESEELVPRSLAEIERHISDYYVFEVDGNIVGCIAIHPYLDQKKAELACVFVSNKHENQGIGAKLVQFGEGQAERLGAKELFCLTTQAANYFVQKGGFQVGTPDDLPPPRRQRYDVSGRKSKVLTKSLPPAKSTAI
ncbi:MAG: amino-acid N-acetyltransferase [Gemmataceae bacterium]|nr:amino-acid N-acetyltransferase [Gemmataceae bacterium]